MTDPVTPALTLAAAELRAQRARDRLHATVAQLQSRLDPRPGVEKATREMRVAGETAVAIARDRPEVAGGVVAGSVLTLGMFLARHRIARLLTGRRADTPPANAGLTPVTRTDP